MTACLTFRRTWLPRWARVGTRERTLPATTPRHIEARLYRPRRDANARVLFRTKEVRFPNVEHAPVPQTNSMRHMTPSHASSEARPEEARDVKFRATIDALVSLEFPLAKSVFSGPEIARLTLPPLPPPFALISHGRCFQERRGERVETRATTYEHRRSHQVRVPRSREISRYRSWSMRRHRESHASSFSRARFVLARAVSTLAVVFVEHHRRDPSGVPLSIYCLQQSRGVRAPKRAAERAPRPSFVQELATTRSSHVVRERIARAQAPSAALARVSSLATAFDSSFSFAFLRPSTTDPSPRLRFRRAAVRMGFIGQLPGKTPEATMASALYTDIKRWKAGIPGSVFCRYGPRTSFRPSAQDTVTRNARPTARTTHPSSQPAPVTFRAGVGADWNQTIVFQTQSFERDNLMPHVSDSLGNAQIITRVSESRESRRREGSLPVEISGGAFLS